MRPKFPQLSRFAGEHGLGMIVDERPPAENPVTVSVGFSPEREVALPVAQTHLAGLVAQNPYRAFGINE